MTGFTNTDQIVTRTEMCVFVCVRACVCVHVCTCVYACIGSVYICCVYVYMLCVCVCMCVLLYVSLCEEDCL